MIARTPPFGFKAWLLSAAAVLWLAGAVPACAETLESALEAVYESSPTINAERARLRATDEELAKAQSGYRPQISMNADMGVASQNSLVRPPKTVTGVDPSPLAILQNETAFKRYDGDTNPSGLSLTVAQPLFDGFRTTNSVHEADASIMAERENLRDIEQRTLLDTVKAYMDVLRDAATVTLRKNSLRLLSYEANATQERFAAGEMTRTDVAQARAREAEAKASLELAKANLRGSLANYQRLVGHVPSRLTDPAGFERLLPTRLEDAVEAAVLRNPQVLQAAFTEKASSYVVKKTLGEMLPQVTLQASHNERYNPTTVLDQQSIQSASVRVSFPLYQAGDVEARVRQAKQQRQGRIQEIEGARELARAQAISSFAQVQAMRAQVLAVRQQVQATTESVAGVREEQKAGQRTLLDVLNAEQEQTNAQVSAVNARHDLVVAAYTLLAVMGRLSAPELGLSGPLYDEQKHYAEINGKWGGLAIDRDAAYAGRNDGWATAVEPGQ